MSQNLLSVGFNLPELEAEKARVLEIVRELYAQLQAFDGAKITPINLTGLSELNSATQSADNTLKKINTTLTEFDARLRGYNSVANQTAQLEGKLTTLYTEEAAKNIQLKVAIEERTKALKESAQVSNEDYKARKTASDIAIQQTELEANAIKASKQEEIESQQAWIALLKESDAVANSVAATQIRAEKAEEASFIEANQQKIRALKELEASLAAADAAAVKEAKSTLANTDDYKRLIAEQKSAQQRFTTAYIGSGGKDTQEVIAARKELATINASISQVDKGLEHAGAGGAAVLGKSLTGAVTQLRYMAYILPGIGIAGIFNLAYQAVIAAGDALSNYNEILRDEAKLEEFVVTQINAANEARLNAIKFGSQLSFFQGEIQSTKEQLSVSQSLGEEYYKQYDIKKKLTDEEKAQSTAILLRETGIKDTNEAYTKQLVNVGKIGDELQRLNRAQSQDVLKVGTDKNDVYYKNLTEQRAKVIAQVQKDFEYQKKILDDYDNARVDSENNAAEHTKFVSDETRRVILDNIKNITSETINQNNIIIANQTSSTQQRIDSINAIKKAQEQLALAEKRDVDTNISATPNDKLIAQRDYLSKVQKLNEDAAKSILDTREQFYEKYITSENKAALDEIDTEGHKNEYIYQDDKNSYLDRIQALSDYIEDRKKYILAQQNYELDIARKTTPSDLLPQKELEIQKNADKELLELNNSTREKINSVVDSWYKRQLKTISDSVESQVTKTQEAETEELSKLNESYDKKLLSYSRFAKRKKDLEQKFLESTDLSQIKDDTNQLNDLLSLRAELTTKILEASQKVTQAQNPIDLENSKNELNALLEDSKDINKKISDSHKKTADDTLKYQEDKNKETENKSKELSLALIEIERGLADSIKEIVDSQYEYRIEKIQQHIELYDEQVNREKEAIDRSTLNQKDKTAYEIQLNAQKEAADKAAAKEERKLKHDEAVFNRDIDIAQIIVNTELAVTEQLALGNIAEAYAVGILGAAALVVALATKIPSFAKGIEGFQGGYARFGEAGTELVKEPNRPAYFAFSETIKYLPKGTDIIPMYDSPTFTTKMYEKKDDSWAQTKYLGRMISKSSKSIHNHINIDLGFNEYKHNIIHG